MKQLANWLGNILLALLVLLVVFVLLLPAIFSARLLVVYSGSMAPTLPAGSLAVMSPLDPTTIKVGDIIAYHPPANPKITISHRVIEVVDSTIPSFHTKGDANEVADSSLIHPENLVGRVTWHVPYAGLGLDKINDSVRTVWGLIFLVGLPSFIVLANTVWDFRRPYKYKLREKRLKLMEKRRRQWKALTR